MTKKAFMLRGMLPDRSAPGPVCTVAPAVTGTPTVGETLTTDDGTWAGTGEVTYAYQWQADGLDIADATSGTFELTAGEEGAVVACRVAATDDNGTTTALSNAVGPVAAAP